MQPEVEVDLADLEAKACLWTIFSLCSAIFSADTEDLADSAADLVAEASHVSGNSVVQTCA